MALDEQNNIGNLAGIVQKLTDASTFDQVIQYFNADVQETAPDGTGYTINVSLVGDPFVVPGMPIRFMSGFPSEISYSINVEPSKNNQFYCVKTTNKISKSGYTTEIEVADEFAFNTGYLTGTRDPKVIGA